MASFNPGKLVSALTLGIVPSTIFGGGGKKKPAPAAPPAPPAGLIDPSIAKARDAKRRLAGETAERSSTILTSPSGVLGDPPLDRPLARNASVLGG